MFHLGPLEENDLKRVLNSFQQLLSFQVKIIEREHPTDFDFRSC
jgi:hypothetical protein